MIKSAKKDLSMISVMALWRICHSVGTSYLTKTFSKAVTINMAIPDNIHLWDCKSWVLHETDWKCLQVFHTKTIRKILGVNTTHVENLHSTNTQVLSQF